MAKPPVLFRHGPYYAEILADSISPDGVRLITIETCYPRFIHAEVKRTRMQESSVASSRAIPTEKNIARVIEDPFVPATFNARVKGMGVGEAISELDAQDAQAVWRDAARMMAEAAADLNRIGIDKSRANRLLEPFLFVTDIMTATEWTNFFALRCPMGDEPTIEFPAQLEFQQIAILMRNAMRASEPQPLDHGLWHLPGIEEEKLRDLCELRQTNDKQGAARAEYELKRVSARRMARVSFEKQREAEKWGVSIQRAEDLVKDGHFSPHGHQARPMHHDDLSKLDHQYDLSTKVLVPASEIATAVGKMGPIDDVVDPAFDLFPHVRLDKCFAGPLRGWIQARKEIVGEEDHSLLLDYEVM